MDRFEYKIVETVEKPREGVLDNLGNLGWELVNIIFRRDVYTLYFKRKIVPP